MAAAAWTLLIGLLFAWMAMDRVRVSHENALQAAHAEARRVTDAMTVSLRHIAAIPRSLARQPPVRFFLEGQQLPDTRGMGDTQRQLLRDLRLQDPAQRSINDRLATMARDFDLPLILLADRNGNIVADGNPITSQPSSIGVTIADRTYFQDAMNKGDGSQFVVGRITREPGVYFATRVAYDDGQLLGVLIAKQDASKLHPLLGDPDAPPVLVSDANGVVVMSNRPGDVLRKLPSALAGNREDLDWRRLYLRELESMPWQVSHLSVRKHMRPVVEIGGKRYLAVAAPPVGELLTVWALAPLGGAVGELRALAAGGFVLWAFGVMLLWLGRRRVKWLEAALQARRELVDMAQALPLTAFRYELRPGGAGRFSFIGGGVQRVLGLDEAALQVDPALPWRMAGAPDALPPTQPLEFKLSHGGRDRWVLAHSTPASGPDGGTIYNGYWLDVSETREAENRFHAVFDLAPFACLIFEPGRGITQCNPATLTLFGAEDKSQLLGRMIWFPDLSPEFQPDGSPSKPRAIELLGQHVKSGARVQSVKWRFCRLDGRYIDAEVDNIALTFHGEPQFCSVITDVTLRQQTEAALREARAAAEAASRTKSSFLANMSHELRTPMNAVIGMTHLALEDGLPPKQRSYVQKANEAARNLLQILDDILDVSKIESGHLELERIEFTPESVVHATADVLGLKAEEKGLELLFRAAPDLPPRLVGDPTRLRQILVNLGSNAIKFTERGEIVLGMEVERRDASGVVLHMWVSDTGIGLSPEQAERIFQPFAQADASTTRRFGGTGLGLTICREFVARMDGRMWVDSELGGGSTFHFTARFGVAPGTRSPPLADELRSRRALVVDDNAAAREVLQQMLSMLGVQSDAATGAAEALQLVQQQAGYGWVLVDWRMPDMDGLSCAREMLRLEPALKGSIVLVTSFSRDQAARAASELPLGGVLTKPVTPSTLYDTLMQTWKPAEAPAAEPAARELTALATGARDNLQGARVLLVEDNPLNQELACELLRRAGIEVEVAGDGREALRRLESSAATFDAVLMDCQMPVMDGYSATEAIRANPAWRRLPVIAMTASALASDRDRAFASGMNAHIAKPLDVDLMFETLGRWIGRGQAREAASTAPVPLPPPLDRLSRVDATEGLARCMGNAELYQRLLRGFVEDNRHFERQLHEAVETSDWPRAVHRSHELKGLAGNIGARRLHELAEGLQQACERREPAACLSSLAAVAGMLQPLIEEIDAALGTLSAPV